MLLWLFVILGIIWLDQLSKWLIVTYLPEGGTNVIPRVFRFSYVENRGAAFGMLSDNRWVFIIISSLALAALTVYLFRWKPEKRLARCALAFIIGGGIGNMIDRIFLGYVIDFLDFCAFPKLWKWVFNVADSFVCIGAGLLMLYLVIETVKDIKAEKAAKLADSTDSPDSNRNEENNN